MLFPKACKRCGGDIYEDRDSHGRFLACAQCGWVKDIEEKGPVEIVPWFRIPWEPPSDASVPSFVPQKTLA